MLFEQAGLKWSVARTIHGALALLLVGFTAVWRTAPAYRSLALPVGLACAALPFLHVWKKRKARLARFRERLWPRRRRGQDGAGPGAEPGEQGPRKEAP